MTSSYKTSAYSSYDEFVEGVLATYDEATSKLLKTLAKIVGGAKYVDINQEVVTVDKVTEELKRRDEERLNADSQAEHAFARSMVDAWTDADLPFPNINWSFDKRIVTLGWYSADFEVNVTVDENASCVVSTVDYINFEDSTQNADILSAIAIVSQKLQDNNVS